MNTVESSTVTEKKVPTLTFTHAGRERTLNKHPRVQQEIRKDLITEEQASATPWYLRAKLAGMTSERSFKLVAADKLAIAAARDILNGHAKNHAVFSAWLADRDAAHKPAATLGEIIATYRAKSRCDARVTAGNVSAMYLVLRHARGTPDLTEQEMDKLSLTEIKKSLAIEFQDALVKAAGADELARERAATNANSLLRQARSLFADRPRNNLLEHYATAGLRIPDSVHGFKKAPLLPEPDHTFEPPSDDLVNRIRTAAVALRAADPNGYRIYLLALGCGLRKKEIALLCGSHIQHKTAGDTTRHTIELRTRSHFRTKSRKPRYVPMEDHIWRELVALNPMLAAPRSADPVAPLEDYLLQGDANERYNLAFRRFGPWLAAQGWNRKKKAHELRKLWSSLVAAEHGSDVARKLAGNTAKVFDAHYHSLLKLPDLKILGS